MKKETLRSIFSERFGDVSDDIMNTHIKSIWDGGPVDGGATMVDGYRDWPGEEKNISIWWELNNGMCVTIKEKKLIHLSYI